MIQDGFQSSAVDFLFADKLSFEPQPIAKQRSRNEFLHEASAHEPLVRSRRLLKKPRHQPRLSMRGDCGVEQMEERVGADQVQVFGIRVVFRSARWGSGNVIPLQPETCQVYELDLLPETKPVQATFEPVMIDKKRATKAMSAPLPA